MGGKNLIATGCNRETRVSMKSIYIKSRGGLREYVHTRCKCQLCRQRNLMGVCHLKVNKIEISERDVFFFLLP